MPRRQKKKNRTREKCHQARGDALAVDDSQASTGEMEGPSNSLPSPPGVSPERCPPPPNLMGPPTSLLPTITAAAWGSYLGAGEGAQGQDDEKTDYVGAIPSQRDPLIKRMSLLVQFLLHKFSLNESITKEEMMKIINKKYKESFPEVLHRVSEHMEMVFGLDLKEVDPKAQSFVLVTILEFSRDEYLRGGRRFPKYGLLMPVLDMLYGNNYQASEDLVWAFLNKLGLYDGKEHYLFGEPRKLITKHFVQEKYLEYRQVPGIDPPGYEFLWGPRANAEDNKTKVMKHLSKARQLDWMAFRVLYRETWGEEEQRPEARARFGVGFNGRARARFRAKASKSLQASKE